MDAPANTPTQRQFPCKQCGAGLEFAPGKLALKCPYCGVENEIPAPTRPVAEQDFRATLAKLASAQECYEPQEVRCDKCGASTTLRDNVAADVCPFCGAAIVATATSRRLIKPQAVLPFHINRQQAMECYRRWIAGLWFAPSSLARLADAGQLKGIYVPYWTYDSNTTSDYTGQRGDDYWETEHYTAWENGKSVRKTRQVRKTRWRWVSGRVYNEFDDVLVLASHSLPRKYTEKLEPWDLRNLVGYADEYLSGFVAESYQVDLARGFDEARQIMDGHIRASICRDIGGDHQRIHTVNTRYDDITFKHLLLPIWLCAYLYHEKTYRFLVNGRTGEVQGERPWSWVKIALLALAVAAVVAVTMAFVAGR